MRVLGLSGSLRRPDGIRVRAVSAQRPDASAQPVTPELEDAYAWLTGNAAMAA